MVGKLEVDIDAIVKVKCIQITTFCANTFFKTKLIRVAQFSLLIEEPRISLSSQSFDENFFSSGNVRFTLFTWSTTGGKLIFSEVYSRD